jgi:hypothetical protein
MIGFDRRHVVLAHPCVPGPRRMAAPHGLKVLDARGTSRVEHPVEHPAWNIPWNLPWNMNMFQLSARVIGYSSA